MLRRLKDFSTLPALDNLAALHHRDIVCELANDVEIMGDEQHRHVVAMLQILQQVEDLRLHGDIERRRRLVGDEEIGPVGERHRDHHALTLAARKLMRIGASRCAGSGMPTSSAAQRSAARSAAPCALP